MVNEDARSGAAATGWLEDRGWMLSSHAKPFRLHANEVQTPRITIRRSCIAPMRGTYREACGSRGRESVLTVTHVVSGSARVGSERDALQSVGAGATMLRSSQEPLVFECDAPVVILQVVVDPRLLPLVDAEQAHDPLPDEGVFAPILRSFAAALFAMDPPLQQRSLPQLETALAVLLSLFLSLGANIVRTELGGTAHVWQGLSVGMLAGVGAVTAFVMRRRSARITVLFGAAALAVGTLLSLISLGVQSLPFYLGAAAVTGMGFGTAFSGVVASLAPRIPATARADAFAMIYLLAYLSFGVPAVIAGALVGVAGLRAVCLAYGVVVIALAAVAFVLRARRAE